MASLLQIVFSIATACVVVTLLNVYRTLRLVSPSAPGVIRSGPWSARLTDGSERMTMHQRAVVAVTGLWAMKSSEAIYFTALHDSCGNRLNCVHTYVIEGSDPPARWWSITAYRNYQFIPNAQQRYSFSKERVTRDRDGSWQLTLSPEEQRGNWIPLGDKPGQLVICLRLYNPDVHDADVLRRLPLPRIVRVSEHDAVDLHKSDEFSAKETPDA